MEDFWKWIDKYGEIIIVSTIVIILVGIVLSKLRTTYKHMAEAMKLPNLSGKGMKDYLEHNQKDVEHK